jgi:hypothetical protein
VVGGPGAWQLEKANRLDEFKIDYLIDGEIERVFNDLFTRIMQGDPSLPRIIKVPKEMQATVEEIPVVRHRSTFGGLKSRAVADAVASFAGRQRR